MTHRTSAALISGALLIVIASSAWAQAPAPAQPPPAPQFPTVSVGGLSYIQYSAELEHRDALNAFDVTRAYININGALTPRIRYRLTPDIHRTSDGSLTFRAKYAFVQFDNIGRPGSRIRFGMHQTPWLDFEESINRYRVQGQMFAEREGLIPGSADFGVGYFTPFPGNRGEVEFGVYNGEGYAHSEANKYKSFQGRVTVRPFPGRPAARGLRLSAFYDLGWYAAAGPRRHGIVMGSYEHAKVVATAQWVTATERPTATLAEDLARQGYSFFVEVRQGTEGWAGIARVDRFDPNQNLPGDDRQRVIGGVAYWFKWSNVRLGLLLNDESRTYAKDAGRPDENRLLAQMHVQF